MAGASGFVEKRPSFEPLIRTLAICRGALHTRVPYGIASLVAARIFSPAVERNVSRLCVGKCNSLWYFSAVLGRLDVVLKRQCTCKASPS
jgi:hypothetical protein